MRNKSITVIHFNDESKNVYADLPPDKETVKKLSTHIFKVAMTALAVEQKKQSTLLENLTSTMASLLDNNIHTC